MRSGPYPNSHGAHVWCAHPCRYSDLNGSAVRQLYARGLVWLEVPVRPEDHLSIPPLEVS